MAFNYTSYAPIIEDYIVYEYPPEEMEVTPPIMREKKALPPPTKPKIEISEIIKPDIEPEFTDEPLPVESDPETSKEVEFTEHTEESYAPAPAPKVEVIEPELTESGPVPIAERMPVYNTCDLNMDESEKRKCTQESMLRHIYGHLKYPQMAREVNITGMVVVSFVVDKSGTIRDPKIVKDIGGGCGDAVLDVIAKLGTFYPGKQNGRPVSVIYRVPVRFELK